MIWITNDILNLLLVQTDVADRRIHLYSMGVKKFYVSVYFTVPKGMNMSRLFLIFLLQMSEGDNKRTCLCCQVVITSVVSKLWW